MMLSNIIMSCSHVPINIQQIAVSWKFKLLWYGFTHYIPFHIFSRAICLSEHPLSTIDYVRFIKK